MIHSIPPHPHSVRRKCYNGIYVHMKSLFLFTVSALVAVSQPFTFGVKVGAPASEFLDTVGSGTINFHSYTNRYLFGPTAELRLPFGLGVEVDALYRHYNFQTVGTFPPAGSTLTAGARTGAWEFPLLAKYRFPTKIVRPFVDAGIAWDSLQGFKQTITVVSPNPFQPPQNLNQPARDVTTGAVIGAGLEIKVPYVHISPEFRFTRWTTQHFMPGTPLTTTGNPFPGFTANSGFSSNQNQVEAMIGITF
jgi:outer membrane protein with beta-barrel domain